jgi:hypothetical protein
MANFGQHAAQTTALAQGVQQLGTAAHSTGADMQDLSDKLFTYGKAIVSFGAMELVKSTFTLTVKVAREHKLQLEELRKQTQERAEALNQGRQEFSALRAVLPVGDARLTKQIRLNLELRKALQSVKLERDYHEKINAVLERYPVKTANIIAAASLALWALALKISHQYNQALMQANTVLDVRFKLTEKLARVQAQTGFSTEVTADSAQALLEYGQDLVPEFEKNLKIVGTMRTALGVSAHTGAELVTIFGRQLKTSAESVGNVIAQIASQTGLAAERAAQFAIEIGKALRLLGPGFRTEAAGVTAVITQLAGRVQEMGGNAQAVVAMFQRLSGGSANNFFMRALAGVQMPGQLGSAAGTEEAMRGIERRMQMILTAPEGTNLYEAQLQAIAEIFEVSANDVLDFRQAMQELNTPLDETQTLAKAYKDQTIALGQAWSQVREALAAAVTAGLLPFIRYAATATASLADFVKGLSANKGFIYTIRVVVPLAAFWATTSLISLGLALVKVAYQSRVAAAAQLTFGANFGRAGGFAGMLTSGGKIGFGAPHLALMAGALGIGWQLGSWLNPLIDKLLGWNKKTAETLVAWHSESRSSQSVGKNLSQISDDRRVAIQALIDYAKSGSNKVEFERALGEINVPFGRSREDMFNYVFRKAKEQLETEAFSHYIQHGTVKTKADQAQDDEAAAALERLNERQLEEQKKTTEHNAAIREDSKRSRQLLEKLALPGFDWAHLGATNYPSYHFNQDYNSP